MAQHDPRALSVRLRNYLSGPFLDFQRNAFADGAQGGFHEKLDLHGQPLAPGHKRLLTQCRQLFVHSHAAAFGNGPPLAATARSGFEFLASNYWDSEDGGWFFQTDAAGTVTNPDKDLYGHAFVVFALSYYYRASSDPAALNLVNRTLDVIHQRLRAPQHGGFVDRATRDWQPIAGQRRQNPHMHLLEAYLAYTDCNGDQDVRGEIRSLLQLPFVETATNTLGEFFNDDWSPAAENGHIVEPGHHFEWAWLLDWAARRNAGGAANATLLERADQLFAWGCRHGVDRNDGGVYDEVARDGAILRTTRRVWPHTEYLKALATQLERHGRADLRARLAQAAQLFCNRYLLADGRWHEHLDAAGRSLRPELPGTSGYHLYLGLVEAATSLDDS
ncbi:MAG: AGE family epimerase/isomerase [Planctomycetota bacterium]